MGVVVKFISEEELKLLRFLMRRVAEAQNSGEEVVATYNGDAILVSPNSDPEELFEIYRETAAGPYQGFIH